MLRCWMLDVSFNVGAAQLATFPQPGGEIRMPPLNPPPYNRRNDTASCCQYQKVLVGDSLKFIDPCDLLQ